MSSSSPTAYLAPIVASDYLSDAAAMHRYTINASEQSCIRCRLAFRLAFVDCIRITCSIDICFCFVLFQGYAPFLSTNELTKM